MPTLYVGLEAPKEYTVDFIQGDSLLDMSTITDATFEIRKPDGSTVSWTAVLSAQTTDTITLTYTFSGGGGDLDQAGTWHFYAKFEVPGGFERSEEWVEHVRLEHG